MLGGLEAVLIGVGCSLWLRAGPSQSASISRENSTESGLGLPVGSAPHVRAPHTMSEEQAAVALEEKAHRRRYRKVEADALNMLEGSEWCVRPHLKLSF